MRASTIVWGTVAIAMAAVAGVVVAEKSSHFIVSDQVNVSAPVQTQQAIRINAPVEKVWALMTNVNHWAAWQKDISHPRMGGPFQPGQTFDWQSGGLQIHSTVGVAEPMQRIVWSGPAFGSFAIHTWTFTAHGGYTQVVVQESMEGWLVSLATPVFQRGLNQSIAVWLGALKQSAEGGVSAYRSGESR